ncbi:hypothetical protein [Loktanella sp. R86503]|uniref:hypothetical protein n=1 Tax=Loktanella sp. R86503 TaxID=3093847 RepID=UPI0036DCCDE0
MTDVSQQRDAAGRFGGRGTCRAKSPAPTTLFMPLLSAIDQLLAKLGEAFDVLAACTPTAEGEGVPVAVLAASPSAGKSTVARKLCNERYKNDAVVYHAPTLSLIEDAAAHAAELGTEPQVLRGRAAPDPEQPGCTMCQKAPLVSRGIALGLSVRETFCQSSTNPAQRCAHFDNCAYLRQQSETVPEGHQYMATAHLSLPNPSDTKPALRIVDETFWAGQLSTMSIAAADFTLPRPSRPRGTQSCKGDSARAKQLSDLLKAARAVVDQMTAGKSPLVLCYTAADYRAFAELEVQLQTASPDVRPDQSSAQQDSLLASAEQSARSAAQYSAIWTCLADAKEKGRDTVERLTLRQMPECLTLRVSCKRELQHREPMLLLDADADTEILTALGCDIRHTSSMTLRPHAEIVQIHDRRMTHGSLMGGKELREDWRRVIVREVLRDRYAQNTGVLVGASRKVVQAFFEDAGYNFAGKSNDDVSKFMLNTRLHGAQWLWYGGRSLGSNRYAACSTVIAIGREELPVFALEDYGRAIWGDRQDADLTFLTPGPDGIFRMVDMEVGYEMSNGEAWAVQVPCHPDPMIRRVQRQTREFATRQLVERLRLARATVPKRVILGCNIPIPGLPVTELIAWEAFKPSRLTAAIIEGLTVHGGIRASASGLAADAPRVFQTIDAAKAYIKRYKIRMADWQVSIPEWLTAHIYQIELRQARPHARTGQALVVATCERTALQVAERLWGPLKQCCVLSCEAQKLCA